MEEKRLKTTNHPDGVSPDLVILAPQTMLKGAAEFINKKLKRPVTFDFFDSSNDASLDLIDLFPEDFYQACGNAKAVILHNWIKADSMEQSLKKMASLAKTLKEIHPKIKLFALAFGGAYETLVHTVGGAKKIYSFADDLLIEAINTN